MNFKRQKLEEVSVNLTPLIDVVFLLLIFFMVSTTFTKESRLTLELPEASGDPAPQEMVPLEVIVDAQGQYMVNKLTVVTPNLKGLKAAIAEVSDGDTTQPVVITADAKAPHQSVIRAMDAAGQLGFTSLSLTTREPKPE
ncbi:biopolymer transport protein ExbD [Litorivivens lipolytica]|uniref:Biopolymer transport protein ExbD n=1 Tax=Litorivivens lipolytica TaxID=1524264 RepID=A0A7W4W3M7_9GAMM|nr:biopolymer transport protein ExbD [Litorivivens lipolytica]